ncbi:MAG: Uma2 family endonuclease [Defluviitaleaceae bacterium]|nr:Uma2 family endonuclease [Defluviitaleaceae bacterium]
MSNLAKSDFEHIDFEILDGKIYAMAAPGAAHNKVIGNIFSVLRNHTRRRKCTTFIDGMKVHLSEKDRVIPDVMVVCNPDIIKADAIYGSPDLVVEVLSASTAKRDKADKFKLYESHGVLEYWIASPEQATIEVYLLKDGAYVLDDIYASPPQWQLDGLVEAGYDISQFNRDFSPSIFPDLIISIDEIFEKVV